MKTHKFYITLSQTIKKFKLNEKKFKKLKVMDLSTTSH